MLAMEIEKTWIKLTKEYVFFNHNDEEFPVYFISLGYITVKSKSAYSEDD